MAIYTRWLKTRRWHSGFGIAVNLKQVRVSTCGGGSKGKKLYEKFPIDRGETIMNHRSGILKRLDKSEEGTQKILR